VEQVGKEEQENQPQDLSWNFWPALPLYPYGKRRTIRLEVLQDTIWTFEQIQGIFYVVVPIRMTVVKLAEGGLLVYAPVAPTPECLRLVKELEIKHGSIKYIILPTASGLEHKVFVGPFARYFPQAVVFVAPNQWSFPFNLPLSWLGLPGNRTQVLPADSSQTPFAKEFDYAILGSIELSLGKFVEVAFYHRRSHSLLLTDTIVSIPAEPPAVVKLDPYPLLFHAKNHVLDPIVDTPANRQRGWQRISLFAFYFRPSALETIKLGEAIREARQAPDRSKKAYFGLFPFKWQGSDWQQSFTALRRGGKPIVAPVLQTLILNRASQATLNWADKVASWNFQRIIPCHFDAPITATPQEFREAFTFLEKPSSPDRSYFENQLLPAADFELLIKIEDNLSKGGILPARK